MQKYKKDFEERGGGLEIKSSEPPRLDKKRHLFSL